MGKAPEICMVCGETDRKLLIKKIHGLFIAVLLAGMDIWIQDRQRMKSRNFIIRNIVKNILLKGEPISSEFNKRLSLDTPH